MIFRLRQYKVVPGKTEVFNSFFQDKLLPVQKRYGACLVGRWQTEDGNHIAALWVYDSIEQYRAIQAKVRIDSDLIAALEFRRANLDPLVTETEELFMTSTVPLQLTELSHLDKLR
ncbi:MAG: NIPSNAP family protein [Waterburya sp.]